MTTPDDIPIAQLRKLLSDNIHMLSTQDKQQVLNFALSELPGKLIHVAGDGCRLSLNALVPDEIKIKLHALVQSKMCFYDSADFAQ